MLPGSCCRCQSKSSRSHGCSNRCLLFEEQHQPYLIFSFPEGFFLISCHLNLCHLRSFSFILCKDVVFSVTTSSCFIHPRISFPVKPHKNIYHTFNSKSPLLCLTYVPLLVCFFFNLACFQNTVYPSIK